jgi:ribosome-associated toxin RatA of RatAB toxin-antitoxin module
MKKVTASALVPFSAQQMFDLVNDIESYPQFMPGCAGATLLKKGDGWLEAELQLSQSGFQQAFITRNQLRYPESIEMRLVDGPFSRLEGFWRFTSLGQGCKVDFELGFEMKNRLLQMTLSGRFAAVSQQQVDAICKRAKAIYSST